MLRTTLSTARRGLPTIAIAGALVFASATSGATAALVITGKQIKDNSITTKDIKNGSLTTKDLKSSTVSALQGATGPAGAPGAVGAPGAPGVSGYQIVTATAGVAPDSGGEVTGSCPAGKKVLSAAAELANSYDGTAVDIDLSATKATAYAYNYDNTADTLVIDVICAVVS
ncbi:collagen-like protein [Nocardioides KLBMP 9356]|uniref:Collagen-like protein n=1 Tax=Nocardioides potassii TaxID=2911371 RepID=A0ABS9H4F4_9ACTN|nr:collagen-like protein [Nocardioides potassii]MCF6376142.1 collagen-like protein [Nocardioides potassii]